jgi:hypothetical protein
MAEETMRYKVSLEARADPDGVKSAISASGGMNIRYDEDLHAIFFEASGAVAEEVGDIPGVGGVEDAPEEDPLDTSDEPGWEHGSNENFAPPRRR